MANPRRRTGHQGGVELKERDEEKVERPKMYKVLLHNDDYTPMFFVTSLVQRVFRKSEPEAERITLEVHNKGVAVCGIYTYEIAETKVVQVLTEAAKEEHPLMCSMEPES